MITKIIHDEVLNYKSQLYLAYGNVGRPGIIYAFEQVIWGALFNVYLGADASKELDKVYLAWHGYFHERAMAAGDSVATWFARREYHFIVTMGLILSSLQRTMLKSPRWQPQYQRWTKIWK